MPNTNLASAPISSTETVASILVTGGLGFVGFHLTKHLLATTPCEVCVFDNASRGRIDEDFEQLQNQFGPRLRLGNNLAELIQADFSRIYHLAAINGTSNFYERPYEVLSNNCQITFELLDHLRATGKKPKILYTSSGETYAGLAVPIPTPETTRVGFTDVHNPRWSYGCSKLVGELAVIHSRLPYVVMRLQNVYGPRMGFDHVIPNLLYRLWSLSANEPLLVKNFQDTRSFCYVDDCVRAMTALEAVENEIVHIGTGDEISIGALADLLCRLEQNPRQVIDVGRQDRGSPKRRCPDTNKLRGLTNWEPLVSLEEGLRRTSQWYRQKFTAL